jgi:hypothetical protein
MLHKAEEDEVGLESSIMEAGKDVSDSTIGEGVQLEVDGRRPKKRGNSTGIVDNDAGGGPVTRRRPSRKRDLTDIGQKGRDTKVRRK